jgi:hypothetical protein
MCVGYYQLARWRIFGSGPSENMRGYAKCVVRKPNNDTESKSKC